MADSEGEGADQQAAEHRVVRGAWSTVLIVAGGMAVLPGLGHGQEPGPTVATPGPVVTLPPVTLRPDADPVVPGRIGFPFNALPSEAPDPGRPWRLSGSLDAELVATNNVFFSADRRSDVFLRVTPSIALFAETERVLANVRYAPSAWFYSTYSSQNRLDHTFAAQVNLAVVPDSLFLDIQGFGGIVSATGALPADETRYGPRSNRVQTYDARISPYGVLRFGSRGSLVAGYAFSYTSREGDSQFAPGQSQPFFVSQTFIAHRGYAALRSGEDLGRLAFLARVDGTLFDGDGLYDGSHRALGDVEVRYALTRGFAVLAGAGYESQSFRTLPRTEINGMVWSVGFRYAAPGGSLVIARFQRRDGFNAPFLSANLLLTERLSLQANYLERLSTSALFTQDLLNSVTADELGNTVDAQSRVLVPVPPALGFSSILSAQSSLMRIRLGSVFLSQSWTRDTVSLGLVYREQTPVGLTAGVSAFSESGWSGVLSWSRELTPRTSSIVVGQYGRTRSAGISDRDFVSGTLGLVYRITPTLTSSIRFIATQDWASSPQKDTSRAALIAGIRQTF